MKIEEKIWRDEKTKEVSMTEVTNTIERFKDVEDILGEVVKRHKDGWEPDFVVSNDIHATDFTRYVVLSFRKGEEWKYIKLEWGMKK